MIKNFETTINGTKAFECSNCLIVWKEEASADKCCARVKEEIARIIQ